MQISLYHVDAFTDKIFSGNPAAVCVLQNWISEELLTKIAKENNLPVTAFLVREDNKFHIRWITPEYELELCGHGTMAASYIILNYLEPTWNEVELQSRIETLHVYRDEDFITMNFPAKEIEKCNLPLLIQGLGLTPIEMYQHKNDRCLAVFNSQEEIEKMTPDIEILKKLPHRGITITAPSSTVDFVSRTFYPLKNITEDPATGASHCLLAPYWAMRLNKNKLMAKQLSQRGGEMMCEFKDNRVFISGKVVLYSHGTVII